MQKRVSGLGVPSLPEKGTPKIVPRLSLNRGTMSTENTERKFFEGVTTTTPCSLLHSCGWAELPRSFRGASVELPRGAPLGACSADVSLPEFFSKISPADVLVILN